MAKKISAIVIPAVIDTTGIDKGINSIKTKLSGVRGSIGTRNSGSGGVGGGGNFGAGLPHYGGSAIATGAAAAVGAAAGGRGGGGGGGFRDSPFYKFMEKKMANTEFGRFLVSNKEASSNRASKYIHQQGSKMKQIADRWQNRMDASFGGPEEMANRARNIRYMNKAGQGVRNVGAATGRAYSAMDFGGDSTGKIGIPGLAIGAAGAFGAANYMRQSFTQGGIKSSFSDLSNLESNPALYERAAAIKRRTYGPTGQPTFAQSMVLGAEEWKGKDGGGNAENLASKTDTLVSGAGRLLGMSLESNAGIILGAGNMIKGAQEFASNTMMSIAPGYLPMLKRLGKIFT